MEKWNFALGRSSTVKTIKILADILMNSKRPIKLEALQDKVQKAAAAAGFIPLRNMTSLVSRLSRIDEEQEKIIGGRTIRTGFGFYTWRPYVEPKKEEPGKVEQPTLFAVSVYQKSCIAESLRKITDETSNIWKIINQK